MRVPRPQDRPFFWQN